MALISGWRGSTLSVAGGQKVRAALDYLFLQEASTLRNSSDFFFFAFLVKITASLSSMNKTRAEK